MTKRKDDETPEPPGGRAAERLRQFEEARAERDDDEEPKQECREEESLGTDELPRTQDEKERKL